jgi:HD-like signal output (HDOD) protein
MMNFQHKSNGIDAGELWRHSVAAAIAGKTMAMDRRDNASLVFTACLLHDLGMVVVSRGMGGEYDEVVALSKRNQSALSVTERSLLRFSHAEAGGYLLERWNFRPEFIQAVRFHHEPAAADPEHRWLAAYTCVGDAMAGFMGYGSSDQVLTLSSWTEALDLLGSSAEVIPGYLTQAFAALTSVPFLTVRGQTP